MNIIQQAIIDYPGLKEALCALSFFRARHQKRPLYKTGRRTSRTVSVYRHYTVQAHRLIQEARAVGFRGSIKEMLGDMR